MNKRIHTLAAFNIHAHAHAQFLLTLHMYCVLYVPYTINKFVNNSIHALFRFSSMTFYTANFQEKISSLLALLLAVVVVVVSYFVGPF